METAKVKGRPPYKPTDETRAQVEHMVRAGYNQEQIAATLAIPPTTLVRYFRVELDVGTKRTRTAVADPLFEKITGTGSQAVTDCVFWPKTRTLWRETVHAFKLPGPNGAPVEVKQDTDEHCAPMASKLSVISRRARFLYDSRSPKLWTAIRGFDRVADAWRLAAFGPRQVPTLQRAPCVAISAPWYPGAAVEWSFAMRTIDSGFGPREVRLHIDSTDRLAVLYEASNHLGVVADLLVAKLRHDASLIDPNQIAGMTVAMTANFKIYDFDLQMQWCQRMVNIATEHARGGFKSE